MEKLDAAMTSEEKWEIAKRAFEETQIRLDRCEKDLIEMQSQVNDLIQLCVRVTKSLCDAVSNACSDI